jgi:hypothetical protein
VQNFDEGNLLEDVTIGKNSMQQSDNMDFFLEIGCEWNSEKLNTCTPMGFAVVLPATVCHSAITNILICKLQENTACNYQVGALRNVSSHPETCLAEYEGVI